MWDIGETRAKSNVLERIRDITEAISEEQYFGKKLDAEGNNPREFKSSHLIGRTGLDGILTHVVTEHRA